MQRKTVLSGVLFLLTLIVYQRWRCAQSYYYAGNSIDAERSLRESIRLSPQLPEPHLYLAKVYGDRGQEALARTEAQRFLEVVPDA